VRRPRSLRGRVTLAATVGLALWVAVVTVAFNVVLAHRLAAQADDVLKVRAEAAASTLGVLPTGSVVVHDTRGDAAIDVGTWIFQGRRLVEGPPLQTSLGRRASMLAESGARFSQTDPPGSVRLYAHPVRARGREVATVVTSVSLAPYAQTRLAALWGTATLAVLLLAGVFLVVRAAVTRALSPVEAMTRQAQAWSVHDINRRFGDHRRPTELAALAGTLDALLARLAAVLRHEKQLAAELSHELRTPLARIVAETSLLQERTRGPEELATAHASIAQSAEELVDILETLLATARTEAGAPAGRCDAAEAVTALAARLGQVGSDVKVTVVRRGGGTCVGVDAAVVERALAPVVDNALRYAVQEVRLEVSGTADAVLVDVLDDGPGIAPQALEGVFEAGRRGDPADGHHGAGLGLALARRLVVACGGAITVMPSQRGAAFRLTLPTG
jgi:signal transduction histidine kinase